ncbi:hypothetical protein FQN57_004142 [Myotisia sp. PD_48]|nr:hypothetical protein FQN57_004142 [Myotisia sp. PD_48]
MESNTNTRGIPPRPSRPPIGRARPDTISLARPPQLYVWALSKFPRAGVVTNTYLDRNISGPMTDWRRDNFLVSNPYAPNEDNIDATLSSSSFSSLSPQHIEEVAETSPLAVQLSLDPQLMTLLLNVVESLQPNPVQEEQAEQSTPPQASQASRPFQGEPSCPLMCSGRLKLAHSYQNI